MATGYVYVLVRTDIPLADQIVQVGHACLEAGQRFGPATGICHLVLISVPSEGALRRAVEDTTLAGVRWALFYEPDDALGYTAACSEPLPPAYRRVFRRLPLWTAPAAENGAPSPPRGA